MKLGFVTEQEFDRVVDPAEMVKPYVATAVDLAKTSVREQVR
jgi:fumarate hydratase class II